MAGKLVTKSASANLGRVQNYVDEQKAKQAASKSTVPYNEQKYRAGIDTSFYNNAIKDYAAQQEKNRANQIADAGTTQQNALRQAYVQKLQNERAMGNNLARLGIRGGASENALLGIQNQYGTARSTAGTDYSNAVRGINQSIDENIRDYTSDMNSRAEEYRQNLAQAKWQAEREDVNNAENRKAENQQRKAEYWSTYYTNYYSGMKKKELDAELKKAKKQLKKATTKAQKIRYQQKIAGIQARRGVIANK